jgi:hypothetical protein
VRGGKDTAGFISWELGFPVRKGSGYMTRLKRSRPSPALIVAVVALVAALAGTAVAADPLATTSVSKKKTKKIAKKQANKAVDAFAAATFPISGAELATIEERTDSTDIPISAGGVISEDTATANCQTGERVISGGWSTELQADGVTTIAALPNEDRRTDNGWEASAGNLSTTNTNELTAHAYCLAP